MSIAIYAGTFDPITLGHVDISCRAASLFEHVYIAVAKNQSKQTLLSYQQRKLLIQQSLQNTSNISVIELSGLLVDCARQVNANVIIRGLRIRADMDYELQMAAMNASLAADIETCFLPARQELAFISSSLVREVAGFGQDISRYVPECVSSYLQNNNYLLNNK